MSQNGPDGVAGVDGKGLQSVAILRGHPRRMMAHFDPWIGERRAPLFLMFAVHDVVTLSGTPGPSSLYFAKDCECDDNDAVLLNKMEDGSYRIAWSDGGKWVDLGMPITRGTVDNADCGWISDLIV